MCNNSIILDFILMLPLFIKYKYIEYIWKRILPKERLTTKIQLIIVKQIVQECIWLLFINLQNKRHPIKHMNITNKNGINIDDKEKIPEYIRTEWYWGNSYIL